MKKNEKGHPSACCGFLTLSDDTHETFEICPVCNWEDDDAQFTHPNLRRSANQESLNDARDNYKKSGASNIKYLNGIREPFPLQLVMTVCG